jgi:hypothetical protein
MLFAAPEEATFNMNGGEISRNTARTFTSGQPPQRVGGSSGGLMIHANGRFNMSGGTINNNTAQGESANNIFIDNRININRTGGTIQEN